MVSGVPTNTFILMQFLSVQYRLTSNRSPVIKLESLSILGPIDRRFREAVHFAGESQLRTDVQRTVRRRNVHVNRHYVVLKKFNFWH